MSISSLFLRSGPVAKLAVLSLMASGAMAQVVGSYSYVGCVSDIPTRLLTASHTADDTMTLESCASHCAGYQYFGTEYMRECYCGNSLAGPLETNPDSACSLKCMGDPTQTEICGGSMLLSLYELTADLSASSSSAAASSTTSDPAASLTAAASSSTAAPDAARSSSTTSDPAPTDGPISDPNSLRSWDLDGCYSSTDGFSTFSPVTLSAANSLEVCTAACAAEDMLYAGLYWGDCYCASTLGPNVVPSFSGNCDLLCPGAEPAPETCGGNVPALPRRSLSTRGGDTPGLVLLTIYVYEGAVGGSSSSSTVSATATTSSSPGNSTASASATGSGSATASSPIVTPYSSLVLSTVYATSVYTITSCAATVTDCPARIGSVTTDIISLYTTWCPGNPTITSYPTPNPSTYKAVELFTTVVVTSYVDYCPGNGQLTTVITSQTQVLPASPTYEATIPMVVTTKTLTISGETVTATLTIPSGAAAHTYAPAAGTPIATGMPAKATTAGTATVVVAPVYSAPVYPASNSTANAGLASGTSAVLPKQSVITGGAEKRFGVSAFSGILAIAGALVML